MEKSLVSQLLSAPARPTEYEPLTHFRKDSMAHYLGVSPQYFYNILSGSKHPSKKLHNKIMALIEEIKAEQAHFNNHYDESALMDIVAGNVAGEVLNNA